MKLIRKLLLPIVVKAYWKEKYDRFARHSVVARKNRKVLLGDSITDYFAINEMYDGKGIINRGISGDTTAGVLGRMKESVYDLAPSKVFILIGVNDINKRRYDKGKSAQNIKDILKGIKENCTNTSVYIQSIYPVNPNVKEPDAGRRTKEKIDSLNAKIKEIALVNNAKYLDTQKVLKDTDGNLKDKYTYDGLHLNGFGYKKVFEYILEYINE